MAVTSIMTTDAEIKSRVGANVSAGVTEAMYDGWVLQYESEVNVFARKNFSDAITAGLNGDVKGLFSLIVSSNVAIQAIMYDMSGYTRLREAENMINILRDGVLRAFGTLRDKKNQTFIDEA